MSLSTNTTYVSLVQKLGGTYPGDFIGEEGDVFWDPSTGALKISDGTTVGGNAISGGGGGGSQTLDDTLLLGNTSARGINVGVSTFASKVVVGGATTALIVTGDARITGILTIGTSSITLDGNNNQIKIGTGVTLNESGSAVYSGIITAQSFSGNATSATFATSSGVSTYATNAGIATFATTAGIATSNLVGFTTFYETLNPQYFAVNTLVYVDANNSILGIAATSTTDVTTINANIAALQTEVGTARSTQASLGIRLSNGLTAYGDPISPLANQWMTREFRMRSRRRLAGETTQIVMAFIGDSYTQAPSRYSGPLAKTLQDTFGSAGLGFISFGWYGGTTGTANTTGIWTGGNQPTGMDGTARYDLVPNPTIIGNWVSSYNTASTNTPNISKITSSTANDYVKFDITAGHTSARLFYTGDGTGVVGISWDNGSTFGSNVPLNTVGAGNVVLTGVPVGVATARIKVVSGTVALSGVDMQSTSAGVRFHKLGGSGSSASQWGSVTAGIGSTSWGAQINALGSHLHAVMHGTNDQASSPTPATFATNIGKIFTNINSFLPYSDRLIIMPSENQRTTNTYPMTQYAQSAREYALGVGNTLPCAYLDMQYFFGSPANFAFEYSFANTARQWYAADLIHPDPNTGGRVMVDAIYRMLTSE